MQADFNTFFELTMQRGKLEKKLHQSKNPREYQETVEKLNKINHKLYLISNTPPKPTKRPTQRPQPRPYPTGMTPVAKKNTFNLWGM